jgi:hypothetical protein
MDRFIKIFLVLVILAYFADKPFLYTLIYSVVAMEFVLMLVKEWKKRFKMIKQGQE